MTKSLPSISVIVATYHRDKSLANTLRDLLAQDYPDYEILVVDQDVAHDSATGTLLQDWHEKRAIYWIKTPHPGLTRARNIGIRESRGDIIVFVDDDVRIPESRFLYSHVRPFLDKPALGASAGRVLDPDKKPLKVRRRVGWMGYSGMREPGFGSDFSTRAYSVRGCNMAFRKTALFAVGGFDERYTHSAFREDTDISFRLRRAGYDIWFNHEAWLYHLSASTGGTRDDSIRVDSDLMLNDWRFALFNLSGPHQWLWILRLYASRVIKAGLRQGQFAQRHQAFQQGYLDAKQERSRQRSPGSLS